MVLYIIFRYAMITGLQYRSVMKEKCMKHNINGPPSVVHSQSNLEIVFNHNASGIVLGAVSHN